MTNAERAALWPLMDTDFHYWITCGGIASITTLWPDVDYELGYYPTEVSI